MVRSPDLISIHSPCRGELLRRSLPKSLNSCARNDPAVARRINKARRRMVGSGRRYRLGHSSSTTPASGDQGIDAQPAWSIEDNEQKNETINDSRLTMILDREKATGGMNHEISDSHLAARDESSNSGYQAKGEEK